MAYIFICFEYHSAFSKQKANNFAAILKFRLNIFSNFGTSVAI